MQQDAKSWKTNCQESAVQYKPAELISSQPYIKEPESETASKCIIVQDSTKPLRCCLQNQTLLKNALKVSELQTGQQHKRMLKVSVKRMLCLSKSNQDLHLLSKPKADNRATKITTLPKNMDNG